MYLAASVARELQRDERRLGGLVELLGAHGLDPFTYNAFPYGGFHEAGLKQSVFEPAWDDPRRLAFSLDVSRASALIAGALGLAGAPERHLSVSTHTGFFGPASGDPARRDACIEAWLAAADALAELEDETGQRVVLAFEPEPRSAAGDTRELVPLLARLGELADASGRSGRVARHLGVCLDACHAAVEFEPREEALKRTLDSGFPLGKLQFSSALRLPQPAADDEGRAALLGLAEPVFLHQVTGRSGGELLRCGDLPELGRALDERPGDWLACDEWRCHFHVPVDLERAGGSVGGLATTRDLADELLAGLLARPKRWGTQELHVEIETYTWNVLPSAARGPGDLVDGLEREYRHVLGRLGTVAPG